MDHIIQLKKIRQEAIARLRNSPDFKLAGKLGLLIVDLGETVDDVMGFDEAEKPLVAKPFTATAAAQGSSRPFENVFEKPKDNDSSDQASDEMIDELVAEIEGDAAELDALMSESKVGSLKPFLKSEKVKPAHSNGAAH